MARSNLPFPASRLLPHTALVIKLAFKHRDRRMSFLLRLNKSNEEMRGGVGFQHLISPALNNWLG